MFLTWEYISRRKDNITELRINGFDQVERILKLKKELKTLLGLTP